MVRLVLACNSAPAGVVNMQHFPSPGFILLSLVRSSTSSFLSTSKSKHECNIIFSSVKLCVQRSDSTWPLICLARALVIGPSGITDVGVATGVTVEEMSSSSPLLESKSSSTVSHRHHPNKDLNLQH